MICYPGTLQINIIKMTSRENFIQQQNLLQFVFLIVFDKQKADFSNVYVIFTMINYNLRYKTNFKLETI